METAYDWLSVAIFAGLALLFLQRSVEEEAKDQVWQYLPPALACALGNWLGNNGYAVAAAITLTGTMAYVFYVLRPTLPKW